MFPINFDRTKRINTLWFTDTFDGFETWVLESKLVSCMTGNLGRKSRVNALVVTGNGNGLAGFSMAKAPMSKAALAKAKNRAGQRLMYIPRYKEHTGKREIKSYIHKITKNNLHLSLLTFKIYYKFVTIFSVLHDFYTQFGNTKIFVTKMHEGYGLVCHRVIKCICEAIGIKDMHAKVEGSKKVQHIVKAFFIGLLRQVYLHT